MNYHTVLTPNSGDTYDKTYLKDWADIDWPYHLRNVKKLRSRIFQARKDNNFRRMRSLQRLMLNSSSNILVSIRDISRNSGCKTAGVDGSTIENNTDKINLFYEIFNNGYSGKEPSPTRRIYILEPNKRRPIGIPTIYDRVIQAMAKNSLEPEWEVIFEKGSYGFRPMRNVDDAVFRIWTSLVRPTARQWIVDSDISKCFDSIAHNYIMEKIGQFPARDLILKWLKTGVVINGIWLDSGEDGTPQGSIISPLLCNIALHGLEEELGIKYLKSGYVDHKGRVLFRYADDLVIICHSKEDAEKALEDLAVALKVRGLEVSTKKTRIVHILEGFDFLGYTFKLKPKLNVSLKKCASANYKNCSTEEVRIRRELMGVYASPSKKSLAKIKGKIKETSLKWRSNATKYFIKKMNELIRGYAQARCYWHSSLAFKHLDNYVFKICWKFAIRRHAKQGKNWMKEEYFTTLDLANINAKHVFYAKHNKNKERLDETYLYRFYWFPIRNYYFGKMDKLPDNKMDKEYYDQLKFNRGKTRPFNVLYTLDKEIAFSQDHLCPVCGEYLYDGDKLHMHHIIPNSKGGKMTFQNMVLIHSTCHNDIHSGENVDYYAEILWQYKLNHPRINIKRI